MLAHSVSLVNNINWMKGEMKWVVWKIFGTLEHLGTSDINTNLERRRFPYLSTYVDFINDPLEIIYIGYKPGVELL